MKAYLSSVIKDFLIVCGVLTLLLAGWLALNRQAEIGRDTLWPVILVAVILVSLKYAFFNVIEASEKAQLISYFVFSTIAGIALFVTLFLFTPGGHEIQATILPIVFTLLGAKAVNYSMMYWNGKTEAKAINEKLKSNSTDNQ